MVMRKSLSDIINDIFILFVDKALTSKSVDIDLMSEPIDNLLWEICENQTYIIKDRHL